MFDCVDQGRALLEVTLMVKELLCSIYELLPAQTIGYVGNLLMHNLRQLTDEFFLDVIYGSISYAFIKQGTEVSWGPSISGNPLKECLHLQLFCTAISLA